MELKEFENLVDLLTQIPSISKKQANNLSHYFIKNKSQIFDLMNEMKKLIRKIEKCQICTKYCYFELCEICTDNNREKKLMIVENINQISKLDSIDKYNGKYFVLPFLFDKKFVEKKYDFSFLLDYINNFNEIIIAISPVAEGILTSNLVFEKIRNNNSKIKITQLATGIPIGSYIDYIDENTLSYAIKNRKVIN